MEYTSRFATYPVDNNQVLRAAEGVAKHVYECAKEGRLEEVAAELTNIAWLHEHEQNMALRTLALSFETGITYVAAAVLAYKTAQEGDQRATINATERMFAAARQGMLKAGLTDELSQE